MQAGGAGEGPDPWSVGRPGRPPRRPRRSSRPVAGAGDLHDEVERRAELVADGRRAGDRGRRSTIVSSRRSASAAVGVARRQRALVAGVHGLEHVEGLAPPDLADDDAVGPHAQRVAHEVADRGGADAVGVGGPGLEPHDVRRGQAQLGGVLDGDHPLAVGDQRAERVEQGGLARAGAAADDHVGPGARPPTQQVGDAGRAERAEGDRRGAEPADGEAGPVDGERGHDGVDPRPVGQAGIDERRRAVDPQPSGATIRSTRWSTSGRREVDRLAAGARRGARSTPAPAVDHHLGHGGSASSGSSGPSPGSRAADGAGHGHGAARGSSGWACRTSYEHLRRGRRPCSGSAGEERGVHAVDQPAGAAGLGVRPHPAARVRGPRQAAGEQPGVDGAGDLRVDRDHGHDRRAHRPRRRPRPSARRLGEHHDPRRAQRQRDGPAQRRGSTAG